MKKLLLMAFALVLSACSSTKTTWDFDPKVNFEQYKTYAWVENESQETEYHLDGLMAQRVNDAVDKALQLKGFKLVPKSEAQLLVNYLTKVDKKIDVDTFNTDFGYNPYYAPGWAWGSRIHTQTTVREYEVGTLIIDMIDTHSKRLIWRGSLADTIREKNSPQERVEVINKSVAEILLNYPPKIETK